MSRTYRRKSGDQSHVVNPRDPYNNDRYYGRSNTSWEYKTFEVREPVWKGYWRGYVEKTIKKEVRVTTCVDNPKTHIEILENWLHDKKWERKMTGDSISDTWYKKSLKRHANYQRRSDTKKELARISKIDNFDEWDFVDSKRKSDRWYFD